VGPTCRPDGRLSANLGTLQADPESEVGVDYLTEAVALFGQGSVPAQADITTAVIVSFVREGRPELRIEDIVPDLCGFAARCEQLPAFRNAAMPPSQPGRPGVWMPRA